MHPVSIVKRGAYPGVVRSTIRKSVLRRTATAKGSWISLGYEELQRGRKLTIGCSISSTVADFPPRRIVTAGSTPDSSSGSPPENTSSSSGPFPCFHSTCIRSIPPITSCSACSFSLLLSSLNAHSNSSHDSVPTHTAN